MGMTKNKDSSNNDFIIGYPNQSTLEKIINKDSELDDTIKLLL